MKVDFNNLRIQACLSFDRLTKELNDNIDKYGDIHLSAYCIQKHMDDLRMLISSIACVYEPECEDFKDVFEELYSDDNSMTNFNPENK